MSAILETMFFHKLAGAEGKDELYADLVTSEYKEFMEAIDDEAERVKEAADILVVAIGYLYAKGLDAEAVLREVNKNNMTKFDDFVTLVDTMDFYKNKGVDVEAKVIEAGVYGVYATKEQVVDGYKYEAGKLLKPSRYSKVDKEYLLSLTL